MKRSRALAAIGALAAVAAIALLLRDGAIGPTTNSIEPAADEGEAAPGADVALAARRGTADAKAAAAEAENARRIAAARPEASRDVTLRCVEYPSETPLGGARFRVLDKALVSDAVGRLVVAEKSIGWIRAAQDDLMVLAIDGADRSTAGVDPTVWCVRTRTLRGTVTLRPPPNETTSVSLIPLLVGDDLVHRRPEGQSPPGSQAWIEARKLDRAFDEAVAEPDGTFAVRVPDIADSVLRVQADGYEAAYVFDLGSAATPSVVELERGVTITGHVGGTPDYARQRGYFPTFVTAVVVERSSTLPRASALAETLNRYVGGRANSHVRIVRQAGGYLVRTERTARLDDDGSFRILMPPGDAACVHIDSSPAREDLGKLDADRWVELTVPEAHLRRVSFREGHAPLEGFGVEVHEVVDDVDVFSTWGTGRAGETSLPVRVGRTYRLVFSDRFRRVPGTREFAKRWTASAETDVDVLALPDAPEDER